VKERNGNLFADSHNIFNRWKNYFSQLLNIYGVNDVRQTKVHTDYTLVSEPSPYEAEIATGKMRRYKLPCTDKILEELVQAGGTTLCFEIYKLINSIWNKEEPQTWKRSITVPNL